MASQLYYVYLCMGNDAIQRKKTLKSIQEKHFKKDDVEVIKLDANQVSVHQIIDEVSSYSLLSPNQLVVVENVDSLKKEQAQILADYCKNPGQDIPLILLSSSKKETSTYLIKAIPAPQQIELQKTSSTQLKTIVQNQLKKYDISLAPDAMEYYLQACADNAGYAIKELEKLILWADEGQTISLEECQMLVTAEAEQEVWDMTNAVAAKELSKAIVCLRKQIEQGANAIQLTALLAKMFRQLHLVKVLEQQKTPASEFAKKAGMPNWMLQKYRAQAKSYSLEELNHAIFLFRQTDDDLKGGKPAGTDDMKWMLVERLIIELCNPTIQQHAI